MGKKLLWYVTYTQVPWAEVLELDVYKLLVCMLCMPRTAHRG